MGHDDDLIAEELPEEVDEPCSPPTPPSAVTLADKPRRVCVSKSLSSGESWGSEEGREYTAANRRRTSLQQENRHSAAASESAKSEDEYGGSPDRRTIWRFHEEAEDCGGVRRRSEDWRTFANSWEADEDKVMYLCLSVHLPDLLSLCPVLCICLSFCLSLSLSLFLCHTFSVSIAYSLFLFFLFLFFSFSITFFLSDFSVSLSFSVSLFCLSFSVSLSLFLSLFLFFTVT